MIFTAMDLHDYKNVAENCGRYPELMYTTEFDKYENFREFDLDPEKEIS